MADMLVVRSKVKAAAKKKKLAFGEDAIQKLNKEVEGLITKAAERAKKDGKKTVKEKHV